MRKDEVAQLAGVPISEVQQVTVAQIERVFADATPDVVLEVATQEAASFWFAGGRYWFDDPYYGEVCAFDLLYYDPDLGLCVREE